jgi:hypothetical protein
MTLIQFIKSKSRNLWINEPNIRVYVRKATHSIDGEFLPCLDIGNVEVDFDKQRRGIFSRFLDKFEREAKKLGRVCYMESIMNDHLKKYLISKRGYRITKTSEPSCPNAYKKI